MILVSTNKSWGRYNKINGPATHGMTNDGNLLCGITLDFFTIEPNAYELVTKKLVPVEKQITCKRCLAKLH